MRGPSRGLPASSFHERRFPLSFKTEHCVEGRAQATGDEVSNEHLSRARVEMDAVDFARSHDASVHHNREVIPETGFSARALGNLGRSVAGVVNRRRVGVSRIEDTFAEGSIGVAFGKRQRISG